MSNDDLDELRGVSFSNNGGVDALLLAERMKKLIKRIPQDVREEIEDLDVSGLKSRIARCAMNIHETSKAKDADVGLKELKEQVKNAAAPYKEASASQKAIAEYCACLIDRAQS